jgi:hypothetical protein
MNGSGSQFAVLPSVQWGCIQTLTNLWPSVQRVICTCNAIAPISMGVSQFKKPRGDGLHSGVHGRVPPRLERDVVRSA